MRIVELKSQNVKIIYKPATNQLKIGDFISFVEGDLTLVAQIFKIVSSAAADDFNQADLFFVLTNKYGKTTPWCGEVLSTDATVFKTPKEFIEKFMKVQDIAENVMLGEYLAYPQENLKLSLNKFTTPSFIGYEKISDAQMLLDKMVSQFEKFNKSFVVVDFYGNLKFENITRVKAGFQLKLPLDADILDGLCSKMLVGVSSESRAVIEDILFELAQYANESKSGFIPISQLIQVIDDIYQKSKIPQLILLKNKLRKYQRLGVFADTLDEVCAVFNELAKGSSVVLDLGSVPLEWRKEFFDGLLRLNLKFKKEFYLLYNVDEQNSDNAMINNLLFKAVNTGIKPILSSNYRYLSFENIFDFSRNIFLFKTYSALKKRSNIAELLQALPPDSFMLTGNLTNDLFISAQISQEEVVEAIETEENFAESVQAEELCLSEETVAESVFENNSVVNTVPAQAEEDLIKDVDMGVLNTAFKPEPSINLQAPTEISSPIKENIEALEEAKIISQEDFAEETVQESEEIIQQPIQVNEQSIDDIAIEEEPKEIEQINELQEVNILEEVEEIPSVSIEEPELEEEIEEIEQSVSAAQQPVEPLQINPTANLFEDDDEVDESFLDEIETSDVFEQQNNNVLEQEEIIEEMDLDDLDFLSEEPASVNNSSDSYADDELLDLLDDNDDILLEQDTQDNIEEIDFDESDEQSAQAPLQQVAPKIPVYSADYEKKENKSTLTFQEGDLVKHNKYGIGTVKKLTAHGDKVLCHINFEDFGRRLLDPEISQLEKIN